MADFYQEAQIVAATCFIGAKNNEAVLKNVTAVIANWMDTAAQYSRNSDYYRGLVVKCGESIGADSFVADDKTVSLDVLCAKVPELVEELVNGRS